MRTLDNLGSQLKIACEQLQEADVKRITAKNAFEDACDLFGTAQSNVLVLNALIRKVASRDSGIPCPDCNTQYDDNLKCECIPF